jgi:hypothetical protein
LAGVVVAPDRGRVTEKFILQVILLTDAAVSAS